MRRTAPGLSIAIASVMLASSTQAQEPSCEAKLSTCELRLADTDFRLESCFDAVGEYQAELGELIGFAEAYAQLAADADTDGKPDVGDQCPATSLGLVVDERGCSLAQFCRSAPVEKVRDRTRCRRLDWMNDEPEFGNPRDCRFVDAPRGCSNATDEPVVGNRCTSAVVTVSLEFASPAQAATAFVNYPPELLSLPGSGAAVQPRVENLTGAAGLFLAGDGDPDGDGIDERLGIGLLLPSSTSSVPPGVFARAIFDCLPGADRVPVIDDFACEVDSASSDSEPVPTTCTVTVKVTG